MSNATSRAPRADNRDIGRVGTRRESHATAPAGQTAERAAAPAPGAPAQPVVWIKGKAGLGNRLLSAMTGILYARLAGRMAVVDWRDETYSDDGSNSFPALFTSPYVVDLPAETGAIAPALWAGRLDMTANKVVDLIEPRAHMSYKHHWQFSVDIGRLDYTEPVVVFWSFSDLIDKLRPVLRGEFAFLRRSGTDGILRWCLRNLLSVRPDIQAEADAWYRANLGAANRVIGVHVRASDQSAPLSLYLRDLDALVAKMPDATVFLATDNVDVEAGIRRRYKRVVSTPKWFPEAGTSMHQNASCPDRLQGARDALKDILLLARCDYLIFSRSSTFSYVASLMSASPPANILNIERSLLRARFRLLVKKAYLSGLLRMPASLRRA